MAIQVQIQVLLVATEGGGVIGGLNTESNIEVAKPPVFSEEAKKIGGFITTCKLYLRMKIRNAIVEKQIQWVLSYI